MNLNVSDRYQANFNYNFDLSKLMPVGATKNIQRVSWRDLRRRMKNIGTTIIDVRSKEQYDAGHIPYAIHMTEDRVRHMHHLLGTDRFLVTYGADEEAGARVAWQLGVHGHKKVATLKGGFDAWVKNRQTIELTAERAIEPPVAIVPVPSPPPKTTERR
jgi:3-mercaptopyruvate sulfurtransferase SseA